MRNILFKENKVLQDDFFLFLESFAVFIFIVEAVQELTDSNDEEVADIYPIIVNNSSWGYGYDDLELDWMSTSFS